LRESEEAYRQLSNEQRINAIVQEQVNALAAAGAEDIGKQTEAIRANLIATQQQLDAQSRIREQRTREQQVASDLDALRVSLQQISPEAQEYAESIQTITTALEAGVINQGEFDAILGQLKDRFNEATAQADPFSDAWGSAMSSLESAFTDFLVNGMDDFDSFADAVLGITKRLVAEIITEFAKAQIGKALGNVLGGGTGGSSIGGQVLGSVAGEGLKNLLGFGAPAAAAAPAASAFAAPSIPLFGGATSVAGAGTAAASGGLMSGLAAAAPFALGIGAFALLGGLFGGSRKRREEKHSAIKS
jgi:Lambda phage tail tape-measure protein (Tape_meas_lam_C).